MYVDFTCVAGTEHTYFAGYHEFEFQLPSVSEFFKAVISGKAADLSNPELYLPGKHPSMFIVNDPAKDCLDQRP
jgi:hypothetical protein